MSFFLHFVLWTGWQGARVSESHHLFAAGSSSTCRLCVPAARSAVRVLQ